MITYQAGVPECRRYLIGGRPDERKTSPGGWRLAAGGWRPAFRTKERPRLAAGGPPAGLVRHRGRHRVRRRRRIASRHHGRSLLQLVSLVLPVAVAQ